MPLSRNDLKSLALMPSGRSFLHLFYTALGPGFPTAHVLHALMYARYLGKVF